MTVHGMRAGKKRKKLEARLLAQSTSNEPLTRETGEHAANPTQVADVSSRL
jgi:hypothetical protein